MDMAHHANVQFNNSIRAIAKENGLPFSFCNQLAFTEVRQGMPLPDALDWLKGIAPHFTGRFKESAE